jgi:amidase
VGRSPEGLPIGVQIVARPYRDEITLGIAAIVDAAFGYRIPPLARG